MFAILLSAFVLILTFFRQKAGLIFLVFALAFTPRYLGWGIGEAGFAATPKRMAIMAFAISLAFVYLLRPGILDNARDILKSNRYLVLIVALMFLVKLVATIVGTGIGVNILYVFDDLLLVAVPAIGILCLVRGSDDESQVILAMVVALLATALLAWIEALKGSVLLQGIIEVSVKEAGEGGLTDKVRSEAYRAKALFDNPLLLAEFTCIVWPWCVYLWMAGRTTAGRWCGLAGSIFAPAILYLAHTRSGWLVYGISILMYLALRLWDRSGRLARVPIVIAYSLILSTLIIVVYQFVLGSADYIASGMEGSQSVSERLNQFAVVAVAWTESPLIGYGMTRNYGQDLEFLNHIDNYWLRLLLEGGLILLILFLMLVGKVLLTTLRERTRAPTREYRLFMTAALASVLGFCMYKMFLSMPTNNVYFFVIAALIIRRQFWLSKTPENARTALPQ